MTAEHVEIEKALTRPDGFIASTEIGNDVIALITAGLNAHAFNRAIDASMKSIWFNTESVKQAI